MMEILVNFFFFQQETIQHKTIQHLPNGNVVTRKSPFEEIEETEDHSQNSQADADDQTLFM